MIHKFRLQIGNAYCNRLGDVIIVGNIKKTQDLRGRGSLVENQVLIADDERMLSPLVALGQVQKPVAEVTEQVRIRMEVFGSKTRDNRDAG